MDTSLQGIGLLCGQASGQASDVGSFNKAVCWALNARSLCIELSTCVYVFLISSVGKPKVLTFGPLRAENSEAYIDAR